MEMYYFWIIDQVEQGNFHVMWLPGILNLGDYVTKHHARAHHIKCADPALGQQTGAMPSSLLPRTQNRTLAGAHNR
eukprot:15352439-Ditylum_brightwellii.AAC.1